jgi:hypothetical protein
MGLIDPVPVSLVGVAQRHRCVTNIALHNANSTEKSKRVKKNLCAASSIFAMHENRA